MPGVKIRGDGIAARCCEHLLRQAGVAVSLEMDDRPRLPAIMLSDSALALIRDVFQNAALFRDAFAIHQRAVAWGAGAAPVMLPHSAVVVSENVLLESVSPQPSLACAPDAGWTIHAARPLPAAVGEHRFGSRNAAGIRVELTPDAPLHTCWIESVARGWLFLIPDGVTSWLLSVGGPPDLLLGESRVVAPLILSRGAPAGAFPASPRIAAPLCGDGWIACGTAALAFDPLCGDGTANAIREAILASAVIRSALAGGDVGPLLSHYSARLTAGFARHLTLCRDFYRTGHGAPWWDAEVASTDAGLEWCACHANIGGGFRYRLNGFELETVT